MTIGKSLERGISRIKQYIYLNILLRSVGLDKVIEDYKTRTFQNNPIGDDSNIWVMWWQGESGMPEIVKMCYNSIKANAGSHPVVLITRENYKDYVKLPEFIEEKIRTGIIDFTHASDIIRSYLIMTYGGIWVDATILVNDVGFASFVPSDMGFWTCRGTTRRNNVARGKWTSYFQASGKGGIVQSFIYDAHLYYWKKKNSLLVYLLLDYIFWLGYCNIPAFREVVLNVPVSVQGELMKSANREYSDSLFQDLFGGINFSKMSYKKRVSLVTEEGKPTIYSYLRDKYLHETV